MRYVILGTAGHIDHGKSALVKALTGIDPDRLKEEKERGITIDLGFAYLKYPGDLNVGIVDVPGHERLIKNMLAGAGGIDLVLMVIAADAGIMPQSKEHLSICNLLKIKQGLIAVTKSDLVDGEWLGLVKNDIRNMVKGTFFEGSEILEVSSKTGYNLELLREKIRELASGTEPKPVKGIFRLPVDRVFTLKGFGTVVTGTAISGSISLNAPAEIVPKGITTKIRGLQSHGESLKTVYAGQRAAINLQGIAKEAIQRGDVLTEPDKIVPTSVIAAQIELLKDIPLKSLKNRSLVHFHTGTSELIARVIFYDETGRPVQANRQSDSLYREGLKPGDSAYCHFRLQGEAALMAGDRYIIRRFSPLLTIGGGEVLDPLPRRGRGKAGNIIPALRHVSSGSGLLDRFQNELKVLQLGSLEEKLQMKIFYEGIKGVKLPVIEGWIKAELPDIRSAIKSLIAKGAVIQVNDKLLSKEIFDSFSHRISSALKKFHENNPLRPGMLKEELRAILKWLDQKFFEDLLANIEGIGIDKDIVRLKTFKIFLSKEKGILKEKILNSLKNSAYQPPVKEELASRLFGKNKSKELDELLKILVSEGSLVRINDTIYLSSLNYAKMINLLKDFYGTKPDMTVGEFRDILGTSRKFALPFLEHLDSNKITLRVGDVRKFLMK